MTTLELRDLACGYRPDSPLIKDINLEIHEKEICCLLGPNGVGKSTLFKTILNLLAPVSGRVCINGQDTAGWKPKKMSRYMSYVAQTHVPSFPYLVKDIAMFGRIGQMGAGMRPSRQDHERVEQALEDVGIRHLRDRVYTQISGGERQLLMIAKALAQGAEILVMDEPTANLDYGNMLAVMECICRLAEKGMCVIFTTHMPDQAFMCNAKTAVLFYHDPMVFGDCKDVVTEKNLYKAYHTHVQILEAIGQNGKPIRVCAPRFGMMREGGRENNE